ncbi:MAG: Ig-like domain repeat protein, partial [Deltaproteobacteria bacterium]|nr:Ig-like domain repeat protein [Deltaproteobacteria bacterium]
MQVKKVRSAMSRFFDLVRFMNEHEQRTGWHTSRRGKQSVHKYLEGEIRMSLASSTALAAFTLTFCFIGAPHSAYGRADLPTPNVAFTSSPNPSEVQESVTFTATVSSPDNGPTPQGSVTVSEYPPGSQQPIIYGIVTLTDGVGVVTTDKLTEGKHVIFVTYGGEPDVYNGAQSQLSQVVNQVSNPVSAEPLHTVIPVHLDVGNGSISLGCVANLTTGCKVYPGANPGMHLLAFSRQPDLNHLDQPDLIQDGTFRDASSANQFLTDVLSASKDAILIVNAVGNSGFALKEIAENLEKFGAQNDIENVGSAIPFVLLGNGGRNMGQALQRENSTLNVDGHLAADSNGNYTFIQTDYVQYDITLDGAIKIGAKTYTMASSYNPGACDRSNAFHLVVVNRENPDVLIANNSY